MIRSTCHNYKDMNEGKRARILAYLAEYRRMAGLIVDDIWNNGYSYVNHNKEIDRFDIKAMKYELPTYLDYSYFTDKYETTLSDRSMSSLVTQISGLIRGVVEKQKTRIYMFDMQMGKGEYNELLWTKILETKIGKPSTHNLNIELSSKCIDWQYGDETKHFNGFIRLKSIGKSFGHIKIPVTWHRQDLKFKDWTMMGSFLITDNSVNIRWTAPDPVKKTEGRIVGSDQGKTTVLSLSDMQATEGTDIHGHSLNSIIDTLCKKRKGSRAFKKAASHRTNFINASINKLNFSNIKEVKFEDVRLIRYGVSVPRSMQHWTYTEIRDKMDSKMVEEGVLLSPQTPTYRSQRCSGCAIVRKSNRKSKTYTCSHCGLIIDADYNASLNHEAVLPDIPRWLRVSKLNRTGFFWKPEGFFGLDGVELRVPLDTSIKTN
jgi:hypothetical protein